MFVFFHRM